MPCLPDLLKPDNSLTGHLQLLCEKKGAKTILQDAYFDGALKITRPVYLEDSGQAGIYMMNTGGGLLNGDRYHMEFVLREGAEAFITTQSSTKIYKTLTQPAVQTIEIHLEKESLLEYLPDPVIAYQDARFKQQMTVRMAKDASFVCTDIFTPGWAPDGTLFRYGLLQGRLHIYVDDRLILFDHVKLEPDEEISGIGCLEGYTHFGTMIVINEQVNRLFLDELNDLINTFSEARTGLSLLTVPGFALRVLANSTQKVETIINCSLEKLRKQDFRVRSSFLRKY